MAMNIWLEKLSVTHLADGMTPEKAEQLGSTVINEKSMENLIIILTWLKHNQIAHMPFWNWKYIQKEATEYLPACDYWSLCPRIMFFNDEDIVAFKLMWSYYC